MAISDEIDGYFNEVLKGSDHEVSLPRRRQLSEIARSTYYELGWRIPENEIRRALVEAGFSPENPKERARFLNLVKAEYQLRQQDRMAELGEYAECARHELGEEAPIEAVIDLAHDMAEEDDQRGEEDV